jgi:two-component system chemotaxis sensor kinase CheA
MILQPGFSTAEKVTEISGRGVGMDVVRRNVELLRGKIEIHSEKGRGSLFCIRLPLTLAIIDGMLVRVGEGRMIIPTILIEQSLRPGPKQISTVQQRGAMLQVRGELCPLIQLGPLFGCGPPISPCENLVVIVKCEGQKLALVLNELIGQQQVVIKTLGERFKQVKGVSGAAILGDGRVGLILEPTGVLALYNQRGGASFPRRVAGSRPDVSSCVEPQDSAASAQRTTLDQSGATPLPELVTAPV